MPHTSLPPVYTLQIKPWLIAIAILILSLTITYGLWYSLDKQSHDNTRQNVKDKTEMLALDLEQSVSTYLKTLERMARRWEQDGGTDKTKWMLDAQSYIKDMEGLSTVEWIDRAYHVRWVVPLEGNENALGLNIVFDEKRKQALEGASVKRTATVTPPLDLVQGYKAIIVYYPVYINNEFDGFIAGIFDIQKLFDYFIASRITKNLSIEVLMANEIAYTHISDVMDMNTMKVFEKDISIHDITWKLRLIPEQETSALPQVIAIFGIVFSTLVSMMTMLVMLARKRTKMYQLALKSLEEHDIDLEDSRRQLELVIDSTAVGIWDWRVQTGEAIFNERWAGIIGYTLDELRPVDINTWLRFAHPDDLKISEARLQEHWNGEADYYICETRMKHKDGHWVWVFDTGKVVEWNEAGKPIRMIGTHVDISDRKQAEAELLKAKISAEQGERSKSEFLASMSHEIRTPMNGVIGMLDLLLKSELDSDQTHKVKIAQQSAQSLLRLINDILDFSRADAGKLELETVDIDIKQVFEEVAESMAYEAHRKQLELVLDTSRVNARNVKSDQGRIRQILTNLVGNAIKFTESGEILIQVEQNEYDENHWLIVCTIKDTGIGIDTEVHDRLFQRFMQGDTSMSRKYGGTGLGLAISKKLCELMQGDIDFSSESGKGSTFRFKLVVEKSTVITSSEQITQSSLVKILIVDDNHTCRKSLQKQLAIWGAKTDAVKSAAEAIELISKKFEEQNTAYYDGVLIDMEMPGMDGLTLGKTLNNDIRFKKLNLILMTSIIYQSDSTLLQGYGFSAYFSKPATSVELLDALELVMNKKSGTAIEDAENIHKIKKLPHKSTSTEHQKLLHDQTKWPDGTRILLVEDNTVNQLVVLSILKEYGLSADLAADGLEALDNLRSTPEDAPYNLIFMDCQMPEMDGYETTHYIRKGKAGEQYRTIPIIAMTANVMNNDRERCTHAGMNDYIAKPIEPEILYTILKQWLTQDENHYPHKRSHTPEDTVWDRKGMENRMLNDRNLINKIMDTFITESVDRIKNLEEQVNNKDYNQAMLIAHNIKGVAGNLCTEELLRAAESIEKATRTGEIENIHQQLEELKLANERVIERFDEYRKSVIFNTSQ